MTPPARVGRRRLVAVGVAVLAVAGGLVWHLQSGRHWIRGVLVSLAETWLVPEVVLGGFAIEGPTSVRLDALELLDPTGRPFFSVDHLTVSLAEVPAEGQPLRIARLVLEHPVLTLRPDPQQLGFVPLGLSPFVEPDPLADPSSVARQLRPSEILELRHVEIIDGVIGVEIGDSSVLEVDGIQLVLEADPAATPAGTPGHHAHVVFGHPPGLVVEADAFVDLDQQVAWLERGDLAVELSDPALVAKLSPKVQALLKAHELSGRVDGALTGRLNLRSPFLSTASLDLTLEDIHAAAGDYRLPLERGRVRAELADGLAHISEASAVMLGGEVAVRQAEVALAEAQLALAGDLSIAGLALHNLLREGADDPTRHAVLDASGRIFVASGDHSLGLRLDDLRLGVAGKTPVVALDHAEVRDLQLHGSGVPLTVEGVALDGLHVHLAMEGGRIQGLPLPPASTVAPPGSAAPRAHWSEHFTVNEVILSNSALEIAASGAPVWRLPGISGTLQSVGGSQPAPLEARLATGSVVVNAAGTVELAAPALSFSHWSVSADLASADARSVLPPSLRSTVHALIPAGRLQGTGSAYFPLGAGDTQVELALTLQDGAVALPGVRMPVDEGSASLSVAGSSTRITHATLSGAGGVVRVPAAVLDASNKLTLGLSASSVRLDRLRTDAGARVGLGRLSADADVAIQLVSGPSGAAIGGLWMDDARVTIDGDPVGKLVWSDVDAVVEPSNGRLAVAVGMRAGSGASATLGGHMAVGGDAVTLENIDVSVDLADPSGRRALPPAIQAALADFRGGVLGVVGDGVVSLADPLRKSAAATTITLTDGAWHAAGYRFGGLSGSAPLALSDATLRSRGGAVTGLGGRLGVEDAWWAIVDDRGRLDWTLSGLTLEQLRAMEGRPNTLAGAVQGRGKVDLQVTSAEGLQVTAGSGRLSVRDGTLLAVPALAVLSKEGDGTGDDALDVRFGLGPRGADLRSLQIDLGPVRYAGSGSLRWSGAVDVHLEASARPGERATLADLAARLVSWDIRGTLDAPHAQALPLGIDTRTFDQVADDPRSALAPADLPADTLLGGDDEGLDTLPEAGAAVAPPPPDRTEFGNFDDLDDEDDF